MIPESYLHSAYIEEGLSARQIADKLGCSQNKVHYWLRKHEIPRRSISDAVYAFANPRGDPFVFKRPSSSNEWFLYGLGLGLFWGEGNKVNKHSVRLGNTDPALVKSFIKFLDNVYGIDKQKLRLGLQIFSDISPRTALAFWKTYLDMPASNFHKKIIVTHSSKPGTYRRKNKYGVLTVYFSNSKLRDTIIDAIARLRNDQMPS